jgi:uncharacterized protein (TIGR01777 family)
MKVVIAGGTGFLGSALADVLGAAGYDVVVLSRRRSTAHSRGPSPRTVTWTPDGSGGAWASEIDGAAAIVNLAGESIAARWTRTRKGHILSSRILATRSLVEAIRQAARPPAVFLSGSAVGYYGPLGDAVVTEDAAPGRDFLAVVASRWEEEAERAATEKTRVVRLRTGIVLARDGGALPKMLPPFWLGVGGRVGSGRQYWPWIHRTDWLGLARFAIETPAAVGPLNAVAPHPVPNAEFAKALGRAMHRPAFLPTPGLALKLLLGEMAEGLLLSGQRAVPAKAERFGYTFAYPRLQAALADLFR